MHNWPILDLSTATRMGSCNLVLHLELVWTKYLCNKFVALAVLGTSMFEWGRLGRLWCCMPLKLPRSMIYLVNAVRSCASEHVWICAYLKCAILLWFYIWFPISIVSFAWLVWSFVRLLCLCVHGWAFWGKLSGMDLLIRRLLLFWIDLFSELLKLLLFLAVTVWIWGVISLSLTSSP